MFSNVFPSPYVDIIKLFEKNWEKAEFSGDVQLAIDQAIGKKVFAVRGITPATNYLALPKSASVGLGLSSPLLYLQMRILPSAFFSLHIDVTTSRKFVRRITISNRYTVPVKRVGSVTQLACPDLLSSTAGKWCVLALHGPEFSGSPLEAALRDAAADLPDVDVLHGLRAEVGRVLPYGDEPVVLYVFLTAILTFG